MNAPAAYDELIRRSRELSTLASCSSLLGWDEQTCMPPGGADHRANQLSLLAGLVHEQATAPRLGDLLAEIEGSNVVVRGQVTGNVTAKKRLTLGGSGRLNGDVRVGRLTVEDGATLNGNVAMTSEKA